MGVKVGFSIKTCPAVLGRAADRARPWCMLRDQHTLHTSCNLLGSSVLLLAYTFYSLLTHSVPAQPLSHLPLTALVWWWGGPFPSLQAKLLILLQFMKLDLIFLSPHLTLMNKASKQISCLQGYVSECDDFSPWFTFVIPGALCRSQLQTGSSTYDCRITVTWSW